MFALQIAGQLDVDQELLDLVGHVVVCGPGAGDLQYSAGKHNSVRPSHWTNERPYHLIHRFLGHISVTK